MQRAVFEKAIFVEKGFGFGLRGGSARNRMFVTKLPHLHGIAVYDVG